VPALRRKPQLAGVRDGDSAVPAEFHFDPHWTAARPFSLTAQRFSPQVKQADFNGTAKQKREDYQPGKRKKYVDKKCGHK
jgi:hypothetical protein